MSTTSLPESPEPRQKFEAYLVERAAKARRHARKNDLACMLCYLAAIAGSFLATICAAFGDLSRGVIAGLTAVPGTALLANSVFSFEKKCRWHRQRKRKYDSLLMRLRYENADLPSLSQDLREFEEKCDVEYPRLGAMTFGQKDEG